MTSRSETHYRSCNLCEAICGIEIRVENGRIASIRGDRKDGFSRGHICPKAVALQDIHDDPDRLRQPLRRTAGGGWERIGWDAALDETAERIRGIQNEHGRDAIGVYLGNPNVHNLGSLLYGPPLLRSLRTNNKFSATSVDQLPHHVAATLMFGHKLLLPVPDIDRTRHLLVLGANPVVSNGSMMTAPGFKKRLEELKQRGGRLVVVDPRRTETASVADRHHFIRPGSDALLLMALLHVILGERLEVTGRLAEICDSLETVRALAGEFSPECAAPATGIAADDIRGIARDFATAPAAVCYGRMGLSTQVFGGLCQWLINVLNVVTGNLDRPGGAMFTRPAVDLLATAGRGHLGRRTSRVRGLPEFGGELPAAALAEEILTEGPGRIRGLIGRGLSLKKLERAPHGLDLGSLEPSLPGRLRTPERRIELAPAVYVEDVERLREALEGDAPDDSLRLIGRRDLRSNNSWMHNYPRLMGGKDRCTLLMHPDDAADRGLRDSQLVAVESRTGRIEVPLELSDEVMRGVISLPHGWGHHRSGTQTTTARQHPGASLNDVTDDLAVDPLCGTAVLSGVPVRVERVEAGKFQY